jgi:hypothetical protein
MKWSIIRQELMLFNPKNNRIRSVFELLDATNADYASFKSYRKHAQGLLEALRRQLDFPIGAEIEYAKNEPCESIEEFSFQVEIPEDLLNENALISYLNKWQQCLRHEGGREDSLAMEIISHCLNKISLKENIEYKKPVTFKARHNAIVDLLNAMPFMPYWDLWGVFSNQSQKNTLLSKISEYENPMYAAQLTYYYGVKTEGSNSANLLGYTTEVKGCFSESGGDSPITTFVGERDYYDYCYLPQEEEAKTYRSYVVFFDTLMSYLQVGVIDSTEKKEVKTATEKQENRLEKETAFYIGYPIKTSLGRLHFLHLWLKPDEPDATLEQLWTAWWPLHRQYLNWSSLHALLAAELDQLDIAYAIEELLIDLKEKTGKNESFNPVTSVCEHICMLFRVDCACDGTNVWKYEGDLLDKAWAKQTGKKPGELPECSACITQNDAIEGIRFRTNNNHPSNNIQLHRYRRLIEQQLFLAKELNDAFKTKLEREKAERKIVKVQLKIQLDALNKKNNNIGNYYIDNFSDEVHILDQASAPVWDGKPLTKAGEIANFLFDDNQTARQQLIVLITGGLHMCLSEILELNPVKGFSHTITHTDDKYEFENAWVNNGGGDKLKKFLASSIEKLTGIELEESSLFEEHVNKVMDLLSTTEYPCWLTPGSDGLIKPAEFLINLRDKYEKCKESIEATLQIAFDANSITFIKSACSSKSGFGDFRSSLPIETIFLCEHIRKLKEAINGNKGVFYRLFALHIDTSNNKEAIYTNYIALAYTLSEDHKTDPPEWLKSIDAHLNAIGGKLLVVFKKDNGWEWNEIGIPNGYKKLEAADPPLREDSNDCIAQNEYNTLFNCKVNWNCVVLWTFNGWYVKEAGGT